jgi:hypothetical protein
MADLYNTSTKTIIFEHNQELDEQLSALRSLFNGLKQGVKTTGKSLDDLKNAKSLSPEFSSVNATTKYGVATKVAAKDFRWNWFSGYGTKLPEAGRLLNPFKNSKPGDVKTIIKYLTRLTPIPAKTSWQIYKNLGLGPLAYAWGVGTLKRYIGLCYAFTVIRFVMQVVQEATGNEALKKINEFFGIPEYEGTSSDNPFANILHNVAKSSYFPNAFWVAPGFMVLPYVLSAFNWVFKTSTKKEDGREYIIDSHNRVGTEINDIIGLTNSSTPPSELVNEFPPSERKNVKMSENGCYWKDPKYKIANLGGSQGLGSVSFGDPVYVILIPGDGWYEIKDIEF